MLSHILPERRCTMSLYNKIIAKIKKVITNYYKIWVLGEDDPDWPKVSELVWVPQRLIPKKDAFFHSVDTIEFGISKMPLQEEVIFEVQTLAQANEVLQTIKEA
jgi:hypothetical protein